MQVSEVKLEVSDSANNQMVSRHLFSENEFEQIKLGYVRKPSMDYRWYIEVKNDTVCILRSWNPTIIFKVPFIKLGDKYISETTFSAFSTAGKDLATTIKKQNHWNFWIYSLIAELIFNEPSIIGLDALVHKVKIDFNGVHGFAHWQAVYRTGRLLSNQVDGTVLFLFSVFHDFFRETDYADPKHGERAVESMSLIEAHLKMVGKTLTKLQMEKLAFALKYHDLEPEAYGQLDSPLKDDKTVQICLDADKLDLGRVGIQPDERYFLTKEAKDYLQRISSG